MAVNFMDEAPDIIKQFLLYMQNIKGRGINTVDGYYLDLRTFFRFVNMHRKLVDSSLEFDEIKIDNVDIDLVRSVTLRETYEYMYYLQRERDNNQASRARKTSSLRQFYRYLEREHIIDKNPLKDLETPKKKKSLPKYLTLEQSIELLNAVDGDNYYRD